MDSSMITQGQEESPAARWEEAYRRFETPQQEVRKFVLRLRQLGVERWNPQAGILEICCGRGNGLIAWHRLGFSDVHGLDLSAFLLADYVGPGFCLVGDARAMPYASRSRDVVSVQGGLHHMASVEDLEHVLGEVHRVLRPGGEFVAVEPWPTAFLRVVHFVSERRLARWCSSKIDAFATMVDLERETYERWLSAPEEIELLLRRYFEPMVLRRSWGKLMLLGRRQDTVERA